MMETLEESGGGEFEDRKLGIADEHSLVRRCEKDLWKDIYEPCQFEVTTTYYSSATFLRSTLVYPNSLILGEQSQKTNVTSF